eukprot:TRINITY_DN2123_c0_g1_i1.p1 TRINITY_DN2123_c0_g1~~TRINITY_DN2123_c0_g1_i1.p1  ORF type:complete len:116 (-),score=10.36 TRINITY_DN2123_c0_g1_i1:135-482(-)
MCIRDRYIIASVLLCLGSLMVLLSLLILLITNLQKSSRNERSRHSDNHISVVVLAFGAFFTVFGLMNSVFTKHYEQAMKILVQEERGESLNLMTPTEGHELTRPILVGHQTLNRE